VAASEGGESIAVDDSFFYLFHNALDYLSQESAMADARTSVLTTID
jgi:hypothetical protein